MPPLTDFNFAFSGVAGVAIGGALAFLNGRATRRADSIEAIVKERTAAVHSDAQDAAEVATAAITSADAKAARLDKAYWTLVEEIQGEQVRLRGELLAVRAEIAALRASEGSLLEQNAALRSENNALRSRVLELERQMNLRSDSTTSTTTTTATATTVVS